MTIAKYESFLNLFRMASTQLSHLSLASIHRPSIAFFLIISTIFIVPFLAFSTSVEFIPSTLSSIAYTLWDSLFGILTSSPFYFFLLNFLIVALVLSSGILDASSSRRHRELDDPQEGDLHQRGHYNYSSAAQIIHERLAFDGLYGSQTSSLPHLNITESPRVYVTEDGVVKHGYGDEGEDVMGKHIITDSIASFLLQRPAFSDMEGSDDALPLHAVEGGTSSGSKSMRMEEIDESLVESSTARGDYYSQVKQISAVYSVGENGEIVSLHNASLDMHAKDIEVYDADDQHPRRDADVHAEDFNDRRDGCDDAINDASEGGHDVIGNDDDHDGDGDSADGDDDDDGDTHIETECHVTDEVADAEDSRIRRNPSQALIADTIDQYQQLENVGKDMGSFSEDVRARSIPWIDEGEQKGNRGYDKKSGEGGLQDDASLSKSNLVYTQKGKAGGIKDDVSVSKSSPSNSVYTQKGKAKAGREEEGEEAILSMSAEELNERASAFITNFRKKLISTAID